MTFYVYGGSEQAITRPAHWAKSGPKPQPFDPSLCGTVRGYQQHRKFGQERCQGCKDANAVNSAKFKAKKRREQ